MKIYSYDGKANIIGPRVKQARKQQRLSQEMLAARLQIQNVELTQRCISRIETQERFVADYELRALAQVLDVDICWLLGMTDEPSSFS